MVNSSVLNKNPRVELKSKTQLVKLAQQYFPGRRFRVICDSKDIRGGGYEVNLCEETTNGNLVFLTGGTDLSMVGNFLKAKVDSGELK